MISYNVNYDKRTVTAYYEGGRNYWVNSLEDMVYKLTGDLNVYMNYHDIEAIVRNYTLSATVKCHPSDSFDEDKGKELAKEKLNAKFARCKNSVLKTLLNKEMKQYEELSKRVIAKAKKGKKYE